jgi:hypothetical protein
MKRLSRGGETESRGVVWIVSRTGVGSIGRRADINNMIERAKQAMLFTTSTPRFDQIRSGAEYDGQ